MGHLKFPCNLFFVPGTRDQISQSIESSRLLCVAQRSFILLWHFCNMISYLINPFSPRNNECYCVPFCFLRLSVLLFFYFQFPGLIEKKKRPIYLSCCFFNMLIVIDNISVTWLKKVVWIFILILARPSKITLFFS